MNKIRDGTKWYTTLEIINTETGEIINKSQYERENLRIIQKEKNYEFSEKNGIKYGIIKHRWYVREHEQTRLFN